MKSFIDYAKTIIDTTPSSSLETTCGEKTYVCGNDSNWHASNTYGSNMTGTDCKTTAVDRVCKALEQPICAKDKNGMITCFHTLDKLPNTIDGSFSDPGNQPSTYDDYKPCGKEINGNSEISFWQKNCNDCPTLKEEPYGTTFENGCPRHETVQSPLSHTPEETHEQKPSLCCNAMTAECLSCKNDTTVSEYCKTNPTVDGCQKNEEYKCGFNSVLNSTVNCEIDKDCEISTDIFLDKFLDNTVVGMDSVGQYVLNDDCTVYSGHISNYCRNKDKIQEYLLSKIDIEKMAETMSITKIKETIKGKINKEEFVSILNKYNVANELTTVTDSCDQETGKCSVDAKKVKPYIHQFKYIKRTINESNTPVLDIKDKKLTINRVPISDAKTCDQIDCSKAEKTINMTELEDFEGGGKIMKPTKIPANSYKVIAEDGTSMMFSNLHSVKAVDEDDANGLCAKKLCQIFDPVTSMGTFDPAAQGKCPTSMCKIVDSRCVPKDGITAIIK